MLFIYVLTSYNYIIQLSHVVFEKQIILIEKLATENAFLIIET